MKKSDINLDKYFNNAKNVESLLTKDEARNLLVRGSSISNNITNKKGIRNMNVIISAAAAGAVAGSMMLAGLFSGDTDNTDIINVSPKAQYSQSQSETLAHNADENNAKITVSESVASIKTEQKSMKFREIIKNSQIDVKGVNIVYLSDDELASLGIIKNNGEISFSALNDTPFPLQITLNRSGVSVDKNTNANQTIGLNPKFVTDPNGNRLLSLFSMKDKGGMFTLINDSCSFANDLSLEKNKNSVQIAMNFKITDADTTGINSVITILDSLNFSSEVKEQLKIAITQKISALANDTLLNKLNDIQNTNMNEMPSDIIENSIYADGRVKIITMPRRMKLKVDDNDTGGNRIIIRNIAKCEFDSVSINIPKLLFDSEEFKNVIPPKDKPEDLKEALNKMKDMPRIIDDIKEFRPPIENISRINTLIPVAVGFEPGQTDYILWFDATEDFAENLPAALKDRILPEINAIENIDDICDISSVKTGEEYFDVWRACNGSVENLSVYPNPASDNIKVNYQLLEERNVTVSIHDLFGRRIVELKTEAKPAGEHLETIQLVDFQPGMYLIVVQTDKQETTVQRFIVN